MTLFPLIVTVWNGITVLITLSWVVLLALAPFLFHSGWILLPRPVYNFKFHFLSIGAALWMVGLSFLSLVGGNGVNPIVFIPHVRCNALDVKLNHSDTVLLHPGRRSDLCHKCHRVCLSVQWPPWRATLDLEQKKVVSAFLFATVKPWD